MRKIKILFTIYIITFGINSVNGQGWERFYGDAYGAYVAQSNDNKVIMHTGGNLFKIDNTGDVIWNKIVEIEENSAILGLINTIDGGLVEFWKIDTSSSNNYTKVLIRKFDGNGDYLWERILVDTSINYRYKSAVETDEGDILIVIEKDGPHIVKIDNNGLIIFEKILGDGNAFFRGDYIFKSSYNQFIIPCNYPTGGSNSLLKIDSNGNTVWEEFFNLPGLQYLYHGIEADDKGYIITGRDYPNNRFIIKFDSTGTLIWNKVIETPDIEEWNSASTINIDENHFLTVFWSAEIGLFAICYLTKMDMEGNIVWEQVHNNTNSHHQAVIKAHDGGFFLVGTDFNPMSNSLNALLVKTDSLGNSLTNQIEGNIWQDAQVDCTQTAEETTIESWIVQAEKEDRIFYATTDSSGYYNMRVDTGDYVVNVVRPNNYWQACEDSINLSFTDIFDTIQVDYPMLAVVDCSLLEVDVSTPFLRRCFESNSYISYCNKGTILAEDAYVTVIFDEYLTINSTSIPPANIEGNTYTFELGDVGVGECGSFEVNVTVGCDSTVLGQTHCIEAHIFPDSICLPLDPNWDQANIEVNAECIGDSIQFIIQNTGIGNMGHLNDYVIIVDELILRSDEYQINSGTTKSFKEAANGETFRLQTMQTEGHPIGNMPTIAIEGCNAEELEGIHIGFVTQFSENNGKLFSSIDCQENIGSYDPNDKQAYPKGVGDEHFIEQNIDIEYKIRFQNTGTDTAFRVVVIDTISEFLEPTSIIPGASSHPYTFELYGYGVVKFTFDNILLVDSTTNEAGSHGFIKFRIDQKQDNPLGTIIENSASIYFDYNAPIKTNTTFHTVGEDFLEMIIISSTSEKPFENTKLSVYPNPVENVVTFHLEGINTKQIELNLYDMTGRLLRTEMHNSSTFQFSKGDLLGGMYFYSIKTEKGEVNSGKLIVK